MKTITLRIPDSLSEARAKEVLEGALILQANRAQNAIDKKTLGELLPSAKKLLRDTEALRDEAFPL